MKTIEVALSGHFDTITRADIKRMKLAKELGHELVVLIKSNELNISTLADRMEVVRNLKCVDRVIRCIDKDNTVVKTLEKIKPNIYILTEDIKEEIELCKKLDIFYTSMVEV